MSFFINLFKKTKTHYYFYNVSLKVEDNKISKIEDVVCITSKNKEEQTPDKHFASFILEIMKQFDIKERDKITVNIFMKL